LGIKIFDNLPLEIKNVAIQNCFEKISLHLLILHNGRVPYSIMN